MTAEILLNPIEGFSGHVSLIVIAVFKFFEVMKNGDIDFSRG
jgi:hypothetical protein